MLSLGTIVPEGSWCVFYARGLTHNVIFYWYSDLISHTQTHTHTQCTQGPVVWHTHINIYLHYLCAHSSLLYYIYWLSKQFTDIKNLLSTMSFLLKNSSLVKVIYLLIRCYKARFFLWDTNNTVTNGVNKQHTHTHTHTHTHQTLRKVTLERVI